MKIIPNTNILLPYMKQANRAIAHLLILHLHIEH